MKTGPPSRRRTAILVLWLFAAVVWGLVATSERAVEAGVPGFQRLSALVPGHCGNPRLAPDGARIAFERRSETSRSRQVVLLDLASLREEEVVLGDGASSSLLASFQQRPLAVLRDFAWTPVGPFQRRHPFVVAGSQDDSSAMLYLSGVGRLTTGEAAEASPVWSPDGLRLAYVSSVTGQGDLYLMDLKAGRTPRRLTTTDLEAELFPAWAPRGLRLCFVRHTVQGDNLVLIDGLEGPKPVERALTRWTSIQTRPAWSPDGQRIAFCSNHRDPDRFDLYVIDAAGDPTPRLLVRDIQPPERHGPAWTPDGESIVVVLDSQPRLDPLVRVNARNGVVTPLETGTLNNQDPEVGLRNGAPWLVFSAQGRADAPDDRLWRRIYGGPLPELRARR